MPHQRFLLQNDFEGTINNYIFNVHHQYKIRSGTIQAKFRFMHVLIWHFSFGNQFCSIKYLNAHQEMCMDPTRIYIQQFFDLVLAFFVFLSFDSVFSHFSICFWLVICVSFITDAAVRSGLLLMWFTVHITYGSRVNNFFKLLF